MKKLIGTIAVAVAVAFSLSSCMSYDMYLKNDSGQQYHCYGSGWGYIGTPLAYSHKDECIKKAQSQGYHQTQE